MLPVCFCGSKIKRRINQSTINQSFQKKHNSTKHLFLISFIAKEGFYLDFLLQKKGSDFEGILNIQYNTTMTGNSHQHHHHHEPTIVEKMLMKDVKDRQALYKEISTRHQIEAVAVIFILRIEKKPTTTPHVNTNANKGVLQASLKSNVTMNTAGTKDMTLAESQHSQLCVMDPMEEINTIQRVRNTFKQNKLFNGSSFKLIKYDDKRIFAMSTDPLVAMDKMIFARKLVQQEFSSENHNNGSTDSNNSNDVVVSISGGCELGGLFQLTNDYYGDPVNIASKLGEDTAKPGQLLVSFGGNEQHYIDRFTKGATFDLGVVTVSGVEIQYYIMNETPMYDLSLEKYEYDLGANINNRMERFNSDMDITVDNKTDPSCCRRSLCCFYFPCCAFASTTRRQQSEKTIDQPPESAVSVERKLNVAASAPAVMFINDDERKDTSKALERKTQSERPPGAPAAEWKHLIMLQSDLSGFTRLTKKYGILHFMTLIMECRKIFDAHLAQCSGELLKYEGDNIICKFDSTDVAIQYVLKVSQDIAKYNEGKHKDFQIRVKIGMAKGLVLVTDHGDIAGDAWEECCALGEEMGKVGEILVSEAIKNNLTKIPPNCHFEPRPGNEEVPAHYNISIQEKNDAKCF